MTYIALTVGPIYDTFKQAEKTRELWVGSYIFSYFMKKLISKLLEEDELGLSFVVPYVDKNVLEANHPVGVFHDRFIAKSASEDEAQIKQSVSDYIAETLHEIAELIDNKDKTFEALKAYFQYTLLVASESALLEETGEENVVFAIDKVLDTMELQSRFYKDNRAQIFEIGRDSKTQKKIQTNPVGKLQHEAHRFKKAVGLANYGFKSIPEIAASEIIRIVEGNDQLKTLRDNDAIDEYDAFYKMLEDKKIEAFKPHHKYYAVISADGDKMGAAIRTIYGKDAAKITTLSKNLYDYIVSDEENFRPLADMFEAFGGMLIYAGGDDLLGFAPVFGKDGSSIFTLLEQISQKFDRFIARGLDEVEGLPKMSLSFGVNIAYYKYPMIDSITKAQNLLFGEAKGHNTQTQSGSVALSLTKHSGQSFKTVFYLNDAHYTTYKKIFESELSPKTLGSEEKKSDAKPKGLPHNIHYGFQKYRDIFTHLAIAYADDKAEYNKRIDALFDNLVIDEARDKKSNEALLELKDYIKMIRPCHIDKEKDRKKYDEIVSNQACDPTSFERFVTQMAIIKFLRGDK